MENSSNSDKNKLLENKINQFGTILQNFGLNLIQNIGEMKHRLEILAKKTEKIENELIELKELKHQLNDNYRVRSDFLDQTKKIKSQLRNIEIKIDKVITIPKNPSKIENFNNPEDILKYFEDQLQIINGPHELIPLIKKVREKLFILIGGNKILFELKTFETKIKPEMDLKHENIINLLLKKVEEWKSQI